MIWTVYDKSIFLNPNCIIFLQTAVKAYCFFHLLRLFFVEKMEIAVIVH